jgi:twitching motility protein PilT
VIDVFPPHQQQQIRVQLAGVLEAVLSQQLLPVQAAAADGPRQGGQPDGVRAARGPAAGGGAFLYATHRVPAMEIMIATPAIRNLIREGKTHQITSAVQTGSQYGMQTMDQSLLSLCKRGFITPETALARAINLDDLRRSLERDGATFGGALDGAAQRTPVKP